jgi:hypothetical protein
VVASTRRASIRPTGLVAGSLTSIVTRTVFIAPHLSLVGLANRNYSNLSMAVVVHHHDQPAFDLARLLVTRLRVSVSAAIITASAAATLLRNHVTESCP